MDPTTATTAATQDRELVLLRLEQHFGQFVGSLLPASGWQAVPYYLLGGLAAAFTLAWIIRTFIRYTSVDHSWRGRPGPAGRKLWAACVTSWVLFGLWFLVVFFLNDTFTRSSAPGAGEVTAAGRNTNIALWLSFTAVVFALAVAYTIAMYVKDSRSVRWYWAVWLAALRITVYAILCGVFLLPALQTYERTEKRSRVAVVLDVSPSITKVSDEIGTAPGKKLKSRLTTVIEFLDDDKVAFLKTLLEKNPVVVYRFGTRLDEEPHVFDQTEAPWNATEWEAFAAYDFKPFLLRGLSPEGVEAVRASRAWGENTPGTPDWAAAWFAKPVEEVIPENMPPADKDKFKENRDKLERRVDVARTIAQGTNVPDALTATVNREAANMVQGIIVFSDGRSNTGSDSAYAELKQRASREKIPIFTVAVGEDRQTVSIAISDVQAPDTAPPDEAWKIIVEADGVNLANTETEVFLDLYLPGRDPKTEPADHTLPGKLTFLPGDPPHGQTEFVLDPAKLPENLTEESKDAATKKRVLKEGPWSVRARIPKNRQEAFADAEHIRDRAGIQVLNKKLRVLLVASGPSREYLSLKTMLVREVQENRAELCVLLQNMAGEGGTAVQDVLPERLLTHFPTKLDLAPKADADPKERFYNLNEYDLIVAFDPDWSELSKQQAQDLRKWVQEQGGGFIYVAGPINTYQLARVDPTEGRLNDVLEILPVVPEDIIALRVKATPRHPRRLMLDPLPATDLLKLDDAAEGPTAGWESFFTDREKYTPNPDLKVELFPHRGFYSTYPVKDIKETKPTSHVLASLADLDERGERVLRPWLVTTSASAAWRTVFLGSGEMYRIFAYDPPTGKQFYERFWAKLMKHTAALRNVKNARGRILLSKEYTAGSPVRVQARILDPGSKEYAIGAIDPKFRIVRLSANGEREKEFGPFQMSPKQAGLKFDGYYQGQVTPDPKDMPAGDKRYRVVIDVPESAGETLEGEFTLRKADPELDNTRPDFDALRRMAGELDKDLAARIKKPEVKEKLTQALPKENGVTKLAFRLSDRELLGLIPDCMDVRQDTVTNRGKSEDLWDRGFVVPESLTPSFVKFPQEISYVLLAIVALLSAEWMTRKLLRLA